MSVRHLPGSPTPHDGPLRRGAASVLAALLLAACGGVGGGGDGGGAGGGDGEQQGPRQLTTMGFGTPDEVASARLDAFR